MCLKVKTHANNEETMVGYVLWPLDTTHFLGFINTFKVNYKNSENVYLWLMVSCKESPSFINQNVHWIKWNVRLFQCVLRSGLGWHVFLICFLSIGILVWKRFGFVLIHASVWLSQLVTDANVYTYLNSLFGWHACVLLRGRVTG